MQSTATQANPFALLMEPEAVFRTIEKSDRLSALRSRICRPLDKPMTPRPAEQDLAEFDELVDLAAEAQRDSE